MTPDLSSGRRGQALACAATVSVLAALWLCAAAPLWEWYQDRADRLAHAETLTDRIALRIATLPALRQQDGAGDSPRLLDGATDTLAAAALQQSIDALAARIGVRLGSQEILPAHTDGALRTVSVRLSAAASFPALTDLLLGLALSDLPMVVDELTLHPDVARRGAETEAIAASFVVTAYRLAPDPQPASAQPTPPEPTSPEQTPPEATLPEATLPEATPDLTRLAAAIAARPLFSPQRRPASLPRPLVPSRAIRLSGTVVAPEASRAIFVAADGKPHSLTVGDSVDGAVITSIGPGMVTLSGPQGERIVSPSFAPSAPNSPGR